MGNQQGYQIQQHENSNTQLDQNIFDSFKYIKSIQDSRFGTLELFSDLEEEQYIVSIEKKFLNYQEYHCFYQEITERSQWNIDSILKVYGMTEINENVEELSSKIYFEWSLNNLLKEIRLREKQQFFKETEIWYILEKMARTMIFLEKEGIFHGDISLENIFFTAQGQLKIQDYGLLSIYKSNYAKTLSSQEKSFLTPHLLESLKEKSQNPKYDPISSDIFSLGMSLLSTCVLENVINCYNYTEFSIDQQKLNEYMNQLSFNYSMNLYNTISLLIQPEDQSRISLSDILAIVDINEKGQTIPMEKFRFQRRNQSIKIPIQEQNPLPQIQINGVNQNLPLQAQPLIQNQILPQIQNIQQPNQIQFPQQISQISFQQNQSYQNQQQQANLQQNINPQSYFPNYQNNYPLTLQNQFGQQQIQQLPVQYQIPQVIQYPQQEQNQQFHNQQQIFMNNQQSNVLVNKHLQNQQYAFNDKNNLQNYQQYKQNNNQNQYNYFPPQMIPQIQQINQQDQTTNFEHLNKKNFQFFSQQKQILTPIKQRNEQFFLENKENNGNGYQGYNQEGQDINKRVQSALKRSEQTISKNFNFQLL